MDYLNVIDESLANDLLSKGFKLEGKTNDINNVTVWTFSLGGQNFDINNVDFKGKCCFTNSLKKTF